MSHPLLTGPWRRAPLLPWRQPAIILAMVGAAAIMGCAAASAPLFLSSAGSGSLQLQVAGQCPDASYPVLQQVGFGPGFSAQNDVSQSARRAMVGHGLRPPERLVTPVATSSVQTADGASAAARVWYRDGAVDQVRVLQHRDGEGLWLPETTADYLGVGLGDELTLGVDSYDSTPVTYPVVGVYRDLWREPTVAPYWCSYSSLFLNLASIGAGPPALVLASSPDVAIRAGLAQGMYQGMDQRWISPIDTETITVSGAEDVVAARMAAYAASGISNESTDGMTGQLPTMLDRAQLLVDGLRGPVVPVATGGAVLALLLVAAAGSYWADRRATEVRLLVSRGVSPFALGVKAVLELAVPAALGTALGWWAARGLVVLVGPSAHLDPAAPRQAAGTAVLSLVVSLVLLATVAGVRTRAATERPLGARRRWYVGAPWELLLMAGAAAAYLRLRQGEPIVLVRNVAQVDALLVVVPLLFLAAAAVLAARGITGLLRPLRARARDWPTAAFTAVTRAASARPATALVLLAVTLPLSILAYSAGVTTSTEVTLEAKARTVIGSERALISVDEIRPGPALDAVGTVVQRYDRARADGQDVTVLALDRATFERWAFWDPRYAVDPLVDLLAGLAPNGDRGVAGLAVGLPRGTVEVQLGNNAVSVQIVSTADVFPGRRLPEPLVVVDATALGSLDASSGRVSEVWTTRSTTEVTATLGDELRISRVLDRDNVFDVANFRSVSWTFGYLTALAVLIGLIGAGGLLLYLETRQRNRITAYVMARRMGLGGGTHLRSLLLELGGLLGAAAVVGGAAGWAVLLVVYRLVDLDPKRPPGPLLATPTVTLLAGAATTVVIAVLGALYAHRAAARARPAQVLRLAV